MSDRTSRAGLSVAPVLARFVEDQVLRIRASRPTLSGAARRRFSPGSRRRTARCWRSATRCRPASTPGTDDRRGQPLDMAAYRRSCAEIGYLVDEPAPFAVTTSGVDDEIATLAGPQLVVPVLKRRFLLNAANARWGSLYDALYGSDAIAGVPPGSGYDADRGAKVVAWARAFLDRAVPLANGSWADLTGEPVLADPAQLVGTAGDTLLLRHNGLHIEIVIDRGTPDRARRSAGIADVVLESALSTIVDLEDSVAVVDAEDKVAAYANWLGLMRGDLEGQLRQGRAQHDPRAGPGPQLCRAGGGVLTLPGRSLLLVRNVGHLMTTPRLRLADGTDAPEGILDGIMTSLIALHDLRGAGPLRNSRAGSIYIVKPKMHGPDEAGFTDRLFDAIEDLLGLDRHTIKVGVMTRNGGHRPISPPPSMRSRTASCSSIPASSIAPATRCIARCAPARWSARAT